MGSLLLLSPLLIYFPRIIPGIETQPWLTLLLACWAFWCDRSGRGGVGAIGITATTCLLAVMVWTLGGVSPAAAAGTLQFAVGPLLLCGVVAWKPVAPTRRWVATLALALLCLAAFEIALPSAYAAIADALLDRVSVSDGHRGVSLLTPEPTYASLSLMYALMLSLWSGRFWGRDFWWVEYVLVGLLLLTFSTYALLMLVALAFMYRPTLVLACLAGAAVTGYGYLAAGVETDEGIRAVVALSRVLEVDTTAVLASLSLVDPSLGYRATSIAAGPAAALVQPMGFGLGCQSVFQAFQALNWDFAFNDEVIGPVLQNGCLKPSSYLTSILIAYGVLSVVMFAVIVVSVSHILRRWPLVPWWPALGMALLILVVQCQVTTPIPWFILYMALIPIYSVRTAIVEQTFVEVESQGFLQQQAVRT